MILSDYSYTYLFTDGAPSLVRILLLVFMVVLHRTCFARHLSPCMPLLGLFSILCCEPEVCSILGQLITINGVTDNSYYVLFTAPIFKPSENPLYTRTTRYGVEVTELVPPMPTYPETPWALTAPIYGALMGLLCSSGCLFGTRGT